jgi:hypothetical protein
MCGACNALTHDPAVTRALGPTTLGALVHEIFGLLSQRLAMACRGAGQLIWSAGAVGLSEQGGRPHHAGDRKTKR